MSSRFTRREVLSLALVAPVVAAAPALGWLQGKSPGANIAEAPGRVVAADQTTTVRQVELRRQWQKVRQARGLVHGYRCTPAYGRDVQDYLSDMSNFRFAQSANYDRLRPGVRMGELL
jgi:hypothetical protein